MTGSAGFVGRHMVAELQERDWEVLGFDVADEQGEDALGVFMYGQKRFELVVHCAARSPHRAAIDGRPSIMPYNLMLDSAMFDWAIRTRQRRVLYLSSSAAYPIDLQDDFATARQLREDDIPWSRRNIGVPDASYGWAKLVGERMAAAAADAGVAVHVVRPFSGYGEDQSIDFPFGAFADRARRRENPFVIWGSGEQVRDWIHISDVVAGALAVVDADVRVPVNLCTGVGTSMFELAGLICAEAGYSPDLVADRTRPAGVASRVGDPAFLHEIYRPRVSLAEGVRRAFASRARFSV